MIERDRLVPRQKNVSYLALVRHGQTTYNLQGLWTGWIDAQLTEHGVAEARNAAQNLTDIEFDRDFSSSLSRAKDTLLVIQQDTQHEGIPTHHAEALRERNYGIYGGKNKWEIKKLVGDEAFQEMRRGWDTEIPEGETSRDVHERVSDHFDQEMLPRLINGENLLVVAHGNSIRVLEKKLEHLSVEDFMKLEIGTGEVHVYFFDKKTGQALVKLVRAEKTDKDF